VTRRSQLQSPLPASPLRDYPDLYNPAIPCGPWGFILLVPHG
jgi:hypothetical protein